MIDLELCTEQELYIVDFSKARKLSPYTQSMPETFNLEVFVYRCTNLFLYMVYVLMDFRGSETGIFLIMISWK